MAWRNCYASVALINDVNARWPNRSKVSDGTIGDAAHASRTSDHNPWVKIGTMGIVRARDITAAGIDAAWLAEKLRQMGASGDPRLKGGGYIIFNGRITKPDFSGWKVYTGSNKHTKHIHVSFSTNRAGYDSKAGWSLANGGVISTPNGGRPTLKLGSSGQAVKNLQNKLKYDYPLYGRYLTVDGDFGPATEAAVKEFQRRSGLTADGIVGPATYKRLGM